MEMIENRINVKKAVILAGGLGTRFLPGVLAVAKELVTIGTKPILMYHLEDLSKAGITEVLIIGNKLKEESFRNFITPSEEYMDNYLFKDEVENLIGIRKHEDIVDYILNL